MRRFAWLLLLLGPLAILWPSFRGDQAFLPMHTAQFAPLDRWADPALAGRFLGSEQTWNGDTVDKLFPIWTDAVAMRDEGLLWSTYSCGGSPTLAHALEGFLYPPNLLMQWMDPLDAYPILAAITLTLASLLAFAFFRGASLSTFASLIGAVAYGLGAYQTASLQYYMRVDAALWFPLALLSIQSGERRGGVLPFVGLAFAMGMSALAGFPQITFFIVYAAGIQALISGHRIRKREGMHTGLVFVTGRIVAIVLGLLLASPQLLPSEEGSSQSTRSSSLDPRVAWERAPQWAQHGLDPKAAYALAFPYLLGSPSDALMTDDPMPWLLLDEPYHPGATNQVLGYNFLEDQLYFGALPLLLALIALVASPRRAAFPFLGFLTCFAFATAPLPNTFLHAPLRALYSLPLLQVGAPTRMLALAGLFGAWLAALGIDAIRNATRTARATVWIGLVAYGSAAAFVLWAASEGHFQEHVRDSIESMRRSGEASPNLPRVAPDVSTYAQDGTLSGTELERVAQRLRNEGWRITFALVASLLAYGAWRRLAWNRSAAALAFAVVVVDLAIVGRPPNTPVPRAGLLASPPPLEALESQVAQDGPAPHRIVRAALSFDEILGLLRPNLASLHRVPDLSGYIVWASKRLTDLFMHSGVGIAYADRWVAYLPLKLHYPEGESVPLIHPLLDAAGVGWILTHHALPGAYLGPERDQIAEALELVYEDHPPNDDPAVGERFRVYRRTNAMPRAWLVPRVVAIPDKDPLIARMKDPTANYREEFVVWSGDVPEGLELRQGSAPKALDVVRYEPTEVVLRKEGGGSGWAYLSDVWWPGWNAYVDGNARTILPANYAFRAVFMDEGEHEVVFRYEPSTITWGAVISAVAWLALVPVGWFMTRRRSVHTSSEEVA